MKTGGQNVRRIVTVLSLSVACAQAVMAEGAAAQSNDRGPNVEIDLALASDYVARGVSQTQGRPATQVGVSIEQDSAYAFVWASNVSFEGDRSTKTEVDIAVGRRTEIGRFVIDTRLTALFFPDQPSGAGYNYYDLMANVSTSVGDSQLSGSISWTPDFFGSGASASFVEIGGSIPINRSVAASASVAKQWTRPPFDVLTWNAGISVGMTERLNFDLRFHNTSAARLGDVAGSRLVGTVIFKIKPRSNPVE